MAFQSVPETARADVLYQYSPEVIVENTFYFRHVGGYNQTQIDALATTVDGWAGIQARAQISTEMSYLRTEIVGLASENDLSATASAGAGAGAIASSRMPGNVTFAVRRLSGLTGRSARGRVFWPPLCEIDCVGNALIASRADAIVAALDNLQQAVSIIQWGGVIVSRFAAGVKRPFGVTFAITDWSYVNLFLDSQRGRLSAGH